MILLLLLILLTQLKSSVMTTLLFYEYILILLRSIDVHVSDICKTASKQLVVLKRLDRF